MSELRGSVVGEGSLLHELAKGVAELQQTSERLRRLGRRHEMAPQSWWRGRPWPQWVVGPHWPAEAAAHEPTQLVPKTAMASLSACRRCSSWARPPRSTTLISTGSRVKCRHAAPGPLAGGRGGPQLGSSRLGHPHATPARTPVAPGRL